MPIGATIGAAVIGAGATVVASGNASHAQSQAAQDASSTELQVANQNNQLARDMYGKNEAHLQPFINSGMAAGDEYMGLLLGPSATHHDLGWMAPAPATPTSGTGSTATPTPVTPWSSMTHISSNNALAPVAAPAAASTPGALTSVVQQHAAQAIAAGANPALVAQRAAQYGVAV